MYGEDVAALRGDMEVAGVRSWRSESTEPGVVRAIGLQGWIPQPRLQWRVPSGAVKIIVNFGAEPRILTDEPRWQAPRDVTAWIVGPTTRPALSEWHGWQSCVCVSLTPLAAAAALGMPMSELTDTIVDVRDVLGSDGRRLAERVAGAPPAARVSLLQTLVERRVRTAEPADRWVAHTWESMLHAHGAARVTAIADDVGLSRRHFTRQFQRHVGTSPKRMSRILRSQHAMGLLHRGTGIAETAQRCGFYGQSHLDGDFRELTGRPPSALTPHVGTAFSMAAARPDVSRSSKPSARAGS